MFAAPKHTPDKALARDKQRPASQSLDNKQKREHNPIWQSLALRSAGLQPKLAISVPNDPYEQEADRVADSVMRMPEPKVQRTCEACAAGSAPCLECEQQTGVQRQAKDNAEPAAIPNHAVTASSGGHPLDPAVRAFVEPRFGAEFGAVRVHDDPQDRMTSASLDARAFTYGNHIWLGVNEHANDLRLMAHELAHVVQQTSPRSETHSPNQRETDGETTAPSGRTPSLFLQRAPVSKELKKRIELCVDPFYYDDKGNYKWSIDPKPNCSDMTIPADRKRAWKCLNRMYWSDDGKKWTWPFESEPNCSDLKLPVPLSDARGASTEELASAAEAAKHAKTLEKNIARIEAIRKAAPTDVEALARLFTDTKIVDDGTLPGRANAIFEATEHWAIPALQTGIEFGQTGFRKEFLDPWPSSENQVGHFLTAVRMAFDPGVVEGNLMLLAILDAWWDSEMPLRLIIGHEKEPDPEIWDVPEGFVKQYRATTEEDIKNFKAGKLDAIKVGKGKGNSMADLALSHKGWILGRWIAEKHFTSGSEVAAWIRKTLAAGKTK